MNKTIGITLAGLVFNIEEPGYDRLQQYLQSLQKHFSPLPYGSEIVSDIETRFAERFTKKLAETKTQIITPADVENVIAAMGKVEDFEPADSSASAKNTAGAKRLYRNPDDSMIAGVASGIAAYFGWDTTLVRLLFAISVFLGGWGIFLYIALWIIIPEAKTSAEKLEMQGAPVTVSELEKTVKKTWHERGQTAKESASALGSVVRALIQNLFRVGKSLLGIALKLAGIFIAFVGVITVLALTFIFVVMIFNPHSPYIDSAFREVFVGAKYFIAVISGFLLTTLPALGAILIGVSLWRKQLALNKASALILAGIWIVAGLAAASVTFRSLPQIEAASSADNAITKNFDHANFNRLQAADNYNVNVVRGDVFSVSLTGNEKDIERSKLAVTEGQLTVQMSDKFEFCIFCFSRRVTLTVTMPELQEFSGSGAVKANISGFDHPQMVITLSGASRATLDGSVAQNFQASLSGASRLAWINNSSTASGEVAIKLTGASRAEINSSLKNINLEASGSSRLTLTGQAQSLKAILSGSSDLYSADFVVSAANVSTSGSADAEVHVTEQIQARASGSSDVIYWGNPPVTDFDTSGSADITPAH